MGDVLDKKELLREARKLCDGLKETAKKHFVGASGDKVLREIASITDLVAEQGESFDETTEMVPRQSFSTFKQLFQSILDIVEEKADNINSEFNQVGVDVSKVTARLCDIQKDVSNIEINRLEAWERAPRPSGPGGR